jgi:hypothetical protein
MSYEKITYIIDLLALSIQIIAAVLMFLNSPVNRPNGSFLVNNIDFETPQKRNYRLRLGFMLLCIGFILQMGSLIIKNPFVN